VLGGPAGPIAEWVLHLVLDPADARRLLAESKHVQFDKPADLDGKPTIRILLARARGPALRFWLDPTTHLARRIELDFPPAAAPGENPNPEPKPDPSAPAPAPIQPPLAIAWSSGPIETGPIPDTSFAVEPPGDSIALAPPEPKPADRAGDADAAPRPKHALTDQPLPRFQVDAIRSEGKLAPLQSESLAGKVLVIDFWATWCPPCREELPELAKLAETYEKAGAPVWFLAISQDEKPDDGTLTDLVRGTLKELGAENPSLQVALDPESELGKRFEVEALPTLFLVDQKGSVRDVIVGYREGAIKSLREKIDALLKASPESRPGSRK
jgi:thiol-disulfide isomerase/thioredoxin